MNVKHNREKVLQTGLALFCSKGYNNLGIDEICKTTGMTKGAFYNAYKSKENFLLSTIEAYGQQTVRYLTGRLEVNDLPAVDRLREMYTSMFNAQPNNNYSGCMINNMMSELGSMNAIVSGATEIEFNNFLTVIEPSVKQAQIEGDIISHIDSQQITELMHSTFYGSLTRLKSSKDFQQGINTMNLLINSLKPST